MSADASSPKQKTKAFKLPPSQNVAENRSMMPSGPNGGTPMVSKPGKASVSHFICFSNGIKMKKRKTMSWTLNKFRKAS